MLVFLGIILLKIVKTMTPLDVKFFLNVHGLSIKVQRCAKRQKYAHPKLLIGKVNIHSVLYKYTVHNVIYDTTSLRVQTVIITYILLWSHHIQSAYAN